MGRAHAPGPRGGGFHIRPVRGKARFRGRDKSLPYKPWRTPGQTGTTTPRTAVGRDALIIPPEPRGGARFRFLKFPRCGGRERPPYGPGQHGGPPGIHRPCAATNPCRGRFHIRPVRGGARFRGRAMALPYKPWRTPGQMATPPAAAFTAAGGVPIYGVVVTGNVKTVIRRPAALRGPARRCGS